MDGGGRSGIWGTVVGCKAGGRRWRCDDISFSATFVDFVSISYLVTVGLSFVMAEEEEEGEGGEVLAVYPISALPGSAYYIPNFITTAEEATLLQKARLGHSVTTLLFPLTANLLAR